MVEQVERLAQCLAIQNDIDDPVVSRDCETGLNSKRPGFRNFKLEIKTRPRRRPRPELLFAAAPAVGREISHFLGPYTAVTGADNLHVLGFDRAGDFSGGFIDFRWFAAIAAC